MILSNISHLKPNVSSTFSRAIFERGFSSKVPIKLKPPSPAMPPFRLTDPITTISRTSLQAKNYLELLPAKNISIQNFFNDRSDCKLPYYLSLSIESGSMDSTFSDPLFFPTQQEFLNIMCAYHDELLPKQFLFEINKYLTFSRFLRTPLSSSNKPFSGVSSVSFDNKSICFHPYVPQKKDMLLIRAIPL